MKRAIVKRLPALAALLILCLITYFYVDGWFDISFIVRGDSSADADGPSATGDDGPADTTKPPEDTSAPSDTDRPDRPNAGDPEGPDVPDDTGPLEIPAADLLAGDYELSYDEWTPDGGMVLAEAQLPEITMPSFYSSHTTTEATVTYVDNPNRQPDSVLYTPVTVDAKAVTLYMGYIIVETDVPGRVNIYGSDGTPLGSYDQSVIAPAYCRDRDGRPLFISSDAYYVLNEEERRFSASDYDPVADNRGALFDYTPDYGLSSEEDRELTGKAVTSEELVLKPGTTDTYYVVPHTTYSFYPTDENGKRVGSKSYRGGYNYSDSLAAAVDADGHVQYLTRSGSTAIKPSRTYTDVTIGRTLIEFLHEPLTNGPESIGFYFFEHGLTRVRTVTQDKSRYNRGQVYVVSDECVIIDTDGKQLYIPLGYEIISYSSGMILLRGESGYGYMDYTGAWVVDPTLDEAAPFYEGLASVKRDGQSALIDTDGNLVIPFGRFDYISNASTGVIAAYDGGWHILYKMSPAAEG